jgi:mRNA interferase MazF
MIASDPGVVVLLPFPFTNFSTLKQRPCVVISSAAFNRSHPDVIVAAITSHLPPEAARDEYLLSPAEQKSCGLPKPSLIKLGKIVTVDRRLLRRRLGKLPKASVRHVLAGVRAIFADPTKRAAASPGRR